MSNELTRLPTPQNAAANLVKQRLEVFTRILPAGITPDQFAIEAMIAANGLPNDVDADSVKVAVFNAASCGIRLSKQLGQGYLVPFKGQVQLIIGYKGFLELGYASGWLANVTCEAVLAGETYRRWNSAKGPQIEHELPPDREVTWDAITATYCIYRTKAGETGIVTVGRKSLDKLYKAASPKSVWKSDPVAMALKTPIRRAAKLWKQTDRLAAAIHLDEQAEREEPQTPLVPDASPETPRMSLDDIPEPAGPSVADTLADEAGLAATPFELDDVRSRINQATERGEIDLLTHGRLVAAIDAKAKTMRRNA